MALFPLDGQADGLRQPVHAEDVATACVSALTMPAEANRTYNLSDGETLSYREMVCRVFATVGKLPHLVTYRDVVPARGDSIASVATVPALDSGDGGTHEPRLWCSTMSMQHET